MLVLVTLLCVAFAVYAISALRGAEQAEETDLYELVPQDATAVFETDRVAHFVADINNMQASQDGHFLYASELFVYLKNYLNLLLSTQPHGLSRQMNKVLISFHQPDNPMNQVLYCSLGMGDYELLENFVSKYTSTVFPPKTFVYEGEDIRIYPLENGEFLATYVTPRFVVVSFQKKLIEKVIDAYKKQKSIKYIDSFKQVYAEKRAGVSASLYLRMKEVGMGNPEAVEVQAPHALGDWVEFDLKLGEKDIYCSGIAPVQQTDTVDTFFAALARQQSISGFAGERVPETTFFYHNTAISERESIWNYIMHGAETLKPELLQFIDDYAEGSLMTCLFTPDSLSNTTCGIISIPLDETLQMPDLSEVVTENTDRICIWNGSLILAANPQSLSAYLHLLRNGQTMENLPLYEAMAASLSTDYSYTMLIDMETMLTQSEKHARLVPRFFFQHAKFFRHFMMAVQFTYTQGTVYPNVTLLYKI